METKLSWGELFETGKLSEPLESEEQAIAMAYNAWGCALSGIGELPQYFGEGMSYLSKKLGFTVTPENLDKRVEELKS